MHPTAEAALNYLGVRLDHWDLKPRATAPAWDHVTRYLGGHSRPGMICPPHPHPLVPGVQPTAVVHHPAFTASPAHAMHTLDRVPLKPHQAQMPHAYSLVAPLPSPFHHPARSNSLSHAVHPPRQISPFSAPRIAFPASDRPLGLSFEAAALVQSGLAVICQDPFIPLVSPVSATIGSANQNYMNSPNVPATVKPRTEWTSQPPCTATIAPFAVSPSSPSAAVPPPMQGDRNYFSSSLSAARTSFDHMDIQQRDNSVSVDVSIADLPASSQVWFRQGRTVNRILCFLVTLILQILTNTDKL